MKKLLFFIAVVMNTGLQCGRLWYYDPVYKDWFTERNITGTVPYYAALRCLSDDTIKDIQPDARPEHSVAGGKLYFDDSQTRWIYDEPLLEWATTALFAGVAQQAPVHRLYWYFDPVHKAWVSERDVTGCADYYQKLASLDGDAIKACKPTILPTGVPKGGTLFFDEEEVRWVYKVPVRSTSHSARA